MMGIPEILMIVLWGIGLGVALTQHGEPKTGSYNFFVTLVATALEFGLMWWGGFFA
jgi:hypothetical protein